MVKHFALFKYKPLFSFYCTTMSIGCCCSISVSAMITVFSFAYVMLSITKLHNMMPPLSLISL